MTLEPLLAPFTNKGKEVSLGFCLELILELKTENRWNNSGPTGTGLVTGATGIGHTACGCLKVFAKKVAINVRAKRSSALSMGSGFRNGSGGNAQKDHGPGRKAGLQ